MSALVLVLTGYSWVTFQQLQGALATADVTDPFHAADGATDILLVGNDSRTDAQGNPLPPEVLERLGAAANGGHLTDTMILVRIPNSGERAVGISLPRDLYVKMPRNYGRHKLNSAFARARTEAAERLRRRGLPPDVVRKKAIQAGRRFLVDTVEKLTGVGIDHYAEVNLLGFARLTKAIGGVKVCLKRPVHDPYSGAHFPAGPQIISGADALAFVRQRHGLPRGGFSRMRRQQVFLAALADKILSAGILANPARIREIIEATQQALVLDEDFNVLDMATKLQGIASGDIRFVTLPTEGSIQTPEGFALAVDRQRVQRFVEEVIEPQPETSAEPANPVANATGPTVSVFNTTTIDGLAGRASGKLDAAGFDVGAVANAPPRDSTVVRYPPGQQETAESVAEALGGLPVEEAPDLARGVVQVYLSWDYPDPGRGSASRGQESGDGRNADGREAATNRTPAAPRPAVQASDVPCVY